MTTTSPTELYYDPYDVDLYADPYPMFRRLREEVPLYYNERYDFFALSRFDDVVRGFADQHIFTSSRGAVLEVIKDNVPVPPGFFIFYDPPRHTVYRGLVSRVFTPKKMGALEAQIRQFCADALDSLVGRERIDLIADYGAQVPMRAIGMLLGIPEAHQADVRDRAEDHIRTEPGKPRDFGTSMPTGESFADYVDWRVEHPSDDLMTDLLHAELEDETGTARRLTREEILSIVELISSAGNETTNRLIGWAGKVLSDHPDQRRELAANLSLVPNAIEEVLRFEPPALQNARYIDRDIEYYGEMLPAGGVILLLIGAANRDDRRFPDGDSFDIHRKVGNHLTFAYGAHFCLGAALARIEGRVALEELLKRFPDWEVDLEHSELSSSSLVRGWETLPAVLG